MLKKCCMLRLTARLTANKRRTICTQDLGLLSLDQPLIRFSGKKVLDLFTSQQAILVSSLFDLRTSFVAATPHANFTFEYCFILIYVG